MKNLSYKTLEELRCPAYLLEKAPEKVLQFGEGNFLRAFVDYFFDVANERHGFNGKVVLTQPIPFGRARELNAQDCLYTLYLRGAQNGKTVNDKRIISCASRCLNPYVDYPAFLACAHNPDLRYIVSNTTEAGIVYDGSCKPDDAPPVSFPAKLTRFLYERYQTFGSDQSRGLIILSCELIDNNGKELRRIVKRHAEEWALGDSFRAWLDTANLFCSSLVDRIVPGYPGAEADSLNEENGYIDNSLDFGEIFGFWVIEGPDWLREELPFCKGDLPVIVVPDITPYKQRKVRILNGAHTTMVLGAYLAGQNIVRSCMADDVIRTYMNKAIHEEIIPTLTLPKQELLDFAAAVQERFSNPFIDHQLLSISLNSTSKWRARCLPSFKAYIGKFGKLPECLTLGLAFYIAFYNGHTLTDNALIGTRPSGNDYEIHDDRQVLEFFHAHRNDAPEALVHAVLTNEAMWGEDLTKLPSAEAAVLADFEKIRTAGAYAAMKACIRSAAL